MNNAFGMLQGTHLMNTDLLIIKIVLAVSKTYRDQLNVEINNVDRSSACVKFCHRFVSTRHLNAACVCVFVGVYVSVRDCVCVCMCVCVCVAFHFPRTSAYHMCRRT